MWKLAATVSLLGLSACLDNTASLASLTDPVVAIAAYYPNDPTAIGVRVELSSTAQAIVTPERGDCATLGPDVTAVLDGVPLRLDDPGGYDDGGWDEGAHAHCNGALFSLHQAESLYVVHADSTLVLRDASVTWTIEAKDLFANDFVIGADPAHGIVPITWTSADTEFRAWATRVGAADRFESDYVTSHGNVIDVPPGPPGSSSFAIGIAAERAVHATRCDGPLQCELSTYVNALLPTTR